MNSLSEIERSAKERFIPIIRPGSAKILAELVGKLKPSWILEIGTAIGYSGIIMLNASADAKMVTIELDEARIIEAKENFADFGLSDRVQLINDDALSCISMISGKFDFVLMDGPKSHYNELFDHIDSLLNVGGGVLIDDTSYHGWVNGDSYPQHKHRTIVTNMRRFLERLRAEASYEMTTYDVDDGLVFMRKIK